MAIIQTRVNKISYLCSLKQDTIMNNIYLSSKPRYEILDGLRGVAALMVLLFHCLETYSWKWGIQIIDHGYLVVDFFFLLSGFVVGYAYDDRWNRMSLSAFKRRFLVVCANSHGGILHPTDKQRPAWHCRRPLSGVKYTHCVPDSDTDRCWQQYQGQA